MEMTWSQSELMWAMSVSAISVPIDSSAAALTAASRSSGSIISNDVVDAFVRNPGD